jgi:hypothetical protein
MLNDRTESGDKQSEQARIRREHIIQIVIDIISSRKEHRTKMHINKTESGIFCGSLFVFVSMNIVL